MANLKEVKNKIGGVKKTSQITKAMNMVAAAKLRGAQERMERFRSYAEKFAEAMQSVSGNMDPGQFPLMQPREVNSVALVVVTSDRGLCGSFNVNILKTSERLIRQFQSEGKKVSLVCVGKKSRNYFSKRATVRRSYPDIMNTFQMFNAREIATDIAAAFLSGEIDEVRLVYSRFQTVATQRPVSEPLLPVQPVAAAGESGATAEYIYEPDPVAIMETLLPLYLNVMVYHAMLEVSAGEHAARMTAMDNATKACSDMIHSLTLLYNKARQSAITAELMDIVGGAEALKG